MTFMDRRRALMAAQGGEPVYEHGTWEDLFRAIDEGTYATEYAVNETIEMQIGSSMKLDMQIVGFNVDELETSTDKAHVTLVSKQVYLYNHRFNPAYSAGTIGTGALGGWANSELRTYLRGTIFPTLPDVVKNRIVSVKKYSVSYNVGETKINNELSYDTIWIPSNREVNINSAGETSGPIYSSTFEKWTNDTRKKTRYGYTAYSDYWTRSAAASDVTKFSMIGTGGGLLTSLVANTKYYPIGFCL